VNGVAGSAPENAAALEQTKNQSLIPGVPLADLDQHLWL